MAELDKLLRIKVEDFFGRAIKNATDCTLLVDEIFKTTSLRIGYQTIRRFWSHVPSKTKTGISSKNILAIYVGCRDFDEFVHKISIDQSKKEDINFELIDRLFKNIPAPIVDYNDWNGAMMQVLVMYIFSNRSIYETFVEKLHKNEAAVTYVITYYQCYHLLHEEWYLSGLKRCCSASNVLHHKVYGISMEAIAYLFKNDFSSLKAIIKPVQQYLPKIRREYGIVFPLEGALFGLRYVCTHKSSEKAEIAREIEHICTSHSNDVFDNVLNYRTMIRTLIQILCWAGLYNDARLFLDKYGLEIISNRRFIDQSIDATQKLEVALIYSQTGNDKQALKIFKETKLDELRFDRKHLSSVLYLLLALKYTSKNAIRAQGKIIGELNSKIQKYQFHIFKDQIVNFLP